MNLTKNQFAEHFFREISGLNYVYLNYIDEDPAALPRDHAVELLIDKDDYASLLYVITSFPNILSIRTMKESGVQHIDLRFPDKSRFSVKLLVSVTRFGKQLLDAGQVLASAQLKPEGPRVAADAYRFEYFLLHALYARQNMPDRYCQSLKKMPEKERSLVFGHVVSRYRFVIHVLDDLFAYQRKFRLKANRVIKRQKSNNRFARTVNTLRFFSHKLRNLVFGSWKQIDLQPENEQMQTPGNDIRVFLMKKAAV